MRIPLFLSLTATVVLMGCGPSKTEEPADLTPPETTTEATKPAMGSHDMGLNTEIDLPEEISRDWRGAVVEVSGPDRVVGRFDLPYNEPVVLGETGLTATALTFIPAFVMDENGITSASAEPSNPALRLHVTEDGKPDYEGWLFAAMPEIHPFPHDTWSIVLIKGLPAEAQD